MWNWIEKLNELSRENVPFAVATITKSVGSTPRKIGAKMIVLESGQIFGTVGGGAGEKLIIDEAARCIKEEITKTVSYSLAKEAGQVCGGTVEVLIETLGIGPRLYVFGAGHVGQAIAKVMEQTPFSITLIDDREEWLNYPGQSSSAFTIHASWEEAIQKINWSAQNSYAVVLTYDHKEDYNITKSLATRPLRYRGLIGSKNKWQKFQKDMKEADITDEQIKGIKCPIGIADTGNTPQEIAISLAAELLVIYQENSKQ